MQFISALSLLRHKRKIIETISWFLILCSLVNTNEAGVIKRDTTVAATGSEHDTTVAASGTDTFETDLKTAEVMPTVLTALNITNDYDQIATTKLQSVTSSYFPTESSKELTNEILFNNEALKLKKEANELKTEGKVKSLNKIEGGGLENKSANSLQDLKQVSGNEALKTTLEISNTNGKHPEKFEDKQNLNKVNSRDYETSSSLENSLNIFDQNPRPPSRILTELRTQTEEPIAKSEFQNKTHENEKDNLEMLKIKTQEDNANLLIEVTTNPFDLNSQDNLQKTSISSMEKGNLKLLEMSENSKALKTNIPVPFQGNENKNNIKILDSLAELDSDDHQENKIREEPNRQPSVVATKSHFLSDPTTPSLLPALDENKLKPLTKEEEEQKLKVFDSNKKDFGRSMIMEETTTSITKTKEDHDLLDLLTTLKPIISNSKEKAEDIKPDDLKAQVEVKVNKTNASTLGVKVKKPKFISDNSTNAQQLNLPNNAEVWSLAAMKSLPKANVTMETASAHNQTVNELKENITLLSNINFSVNSNSEKNLLDWFQIMMDKELSTTTRNEHYETETVKQSQPKIEDESVMATTTLTPDSEEETKSFSIEPHSVTTTTTTPTSSPSFTSTILSSELNYDKRDNENTERPDKTAKENINIALDTADTSVTTTTATNVDNNNNSNNPLNTSLNIEPNLNEINLTSNQTQFASNDDVQNIITTTTSPAPAPQTSVKKSVDNNNNKDKDNESANAFVETSSVAETTTQTSAAAESEAAESTAAINNKKATAVVDTTTTVEQISSETTTVSTLETTKQYASLNDDIVRQQEHNKNKLLSNVIYEERNSSLPISHNELENDSHNAVVDKTTNDSSKNNNNSQNEIVDFSTITTTAVPITTFRPTTDILPITSTTSQPATIEQEVDQKRNEIQTNLTLNTEHQSIIKTDLDHNQSTKTTEAHLIEIEYETTTPETPNTTTTTSTATTTEAIALNVVSRLETALTTASTSLSTEAIINETSEINLNTTTITETTPEHNYRGNEETTIRSDVATDETQLEKETKIKATTETNYYPYTSTETPVVTDSKGGKSTTSISTPASTFTYTTTRAATTEQNIIESTSGKQEDDFKSEEYDKTETTTKTIMNVTQETTTAKATTTTRSTLMPATAAAKEEETYISLLDDTTTTTTTPHTLFYSSTISNADTTSQATTTTTTTTEAATTTTTTTIIPTTTHSLSSSSPTLSPSSVATKVEEIYNVINSTTTELIETTTQQLLTEIEKESSSTTSSPPLTEMLPPSTTTHSTHTVETADIGKTLPTLTSIVGGNSGNMYPKNSETGETDINVIIAITVSVIGVVALILLVGFLYLMRKRQKQTSYSQRCRPVSLDEYTIDNASISGSMRKSSAFRASKRIYGNLAFDDPSLRSNPMGPHELAKFVQEKLRIFEEFRDVPQITSRLDEVPTGCEDKNRYANVLPLPETRVILQRQNDDEKSEYINANYVTGPKDPPNYYIACQAPLESTVEDFWRMIWEQQSRVIIQATDLIENGVEKCAEYLPPSVTLDNHSSFGDFQITLQNREIKEKYAISTLLLKHTAENATRELTHYWYKWPEMGVPSEETPIIAMLLEARSSLISYAIEQANEDKEKSLKSAEEGTVSMSDVTTTGTLAANSLKSSSANASSGAINGNISMVHIKKAARNQGPLTIHCSPGTGRTGTIIACDIAIRSLETPKRTVDIPQIVYYVRRGRASAVLTKEQYEFIYKVANMYAAKITNPTNYN